MCLIGIAFRAHPRYPLLVAANRDEFHARPTQPAHFWPDAPRLLAGRDEQAGGTWMGITLHGRFAAVTNYREPDASTSGRQSRGSLVVDFLKGAESAQASSQRAVREGDEYGGFSLLVMDGESLWFASNCGDAPQPVAPGVHGLSNQHLESNWPKVKRVREALARETTEPRPSLDRLLDTLQDRTTAPDEFLPDTGVGLERERMLSSPFVATDGYGTRSSTLLSIDADGRVTVLEVSYGADGRTRFSRRFRFQLHSAPLRNSAVNE